MYDDTRLKAEENRGQNESHGRVRNCKTQHWMFISEKSVDATTEKITKKAGVGKGALYRHFSDKGEIVFSLAETSIKPLKQVFVKGLCVFLAEQLSFAP